MRRPLVAIAGIAISVLFGWLAIRGLNFHEVRTAISDASPAWILAAVIVSVIGVTMRAERWRALFPRDSRPRFAPTFWASQVGLLANNVLPGRAGELVRVLALARESGLRRTAVLATVVVERVFDLGAIAVLELAVASRLPDDRRHASLHAAGGRNPGRHGSDRRRTGDHTRASLRREPAGAHPDATGAQRGADRVAANRTRGPARSAARGRRAAVDAGLVARARLGGLVRSARLRPAPALARGAVPARRRHVRAGRAGQRGLGGRVRARGARRRSSPTACRPRSRSRPASCCMP